MTDIKSWLEQCPHIGVLTVDSLGPGLGVGLFAQGVEAVCRDILGNVRLRSRYVLRRRGLRGENWAEQVTRWVLEQKPPQGCTVSVKGGKLRDPSTDAMGTYELEIIVNS